MEMPEVKGTGSNKRSRKKKLVSPRAYKLLWDSHSIAGVIIGLGLFVIFYCGAISLYRSAILIWAEPELHTNAEPRPIDEIVKPFFAKHPPADEASIMIINNFDERPFYWLRYTAASGDSINTWISTSTGAEVPAYSRSYVFEILFRLHYFAQAGTGGQILSGLIAVFFLFAVIGGLLIHLKKLPKDWHTFRPKGKLRTRLADAHTVLGLIGLPFSVMYAITGAFFSLLILILAPTVLVVFDGDNHALEEVLHGFEEPHFEATGEPAAMLSPGEILSNLPDSWEGAEIIRVDYQGWGDAGAFAMIEGQIPETLGTAGVAAISAATGEVLAAVAPADAPMLGKTVSVFTNLHFATIGGWLLELLYFLLAIATSAVILTGNILWIVVRRPKDNRATPMLHKILGRLTIGIGVGLMVAVPILFLTARILPMDMVDRQYWEEAVFFISWALLIVAAFAGNTPQKATRWMLSAAAVLSALVPVVGGVFGEHFFWHFVQNGLWEVFYVDLIFLVNALVLGWVAWRIDEPQAKPAGQLQPKHGKLPAELVG